jgi:iron(III) transport system ATP-binding protein
MTTADTIMVMNRGKVEQTGSPEDIYERPLSEFVARFIGGTNILRGRSLGDGLVDCGTLVLRCGEGVFAPAGETAVSVRPHDIALGPLNGADGPGEAEGRIERQTYLGGHRDYLVALADGQSLRVVAPLSVDMPVGDRVKLHFPPERCRALAR